MTNEEKQIIIEQVKPLMVRYTEQDATLVFYETGRKMGAMFWFTMITVENLPNGKYCVSSDGVMDIVREFDNNAAIYKDLISYFDITPMPGRYDTVYKVIDTLDGVGRAVFQMLACVSAVEKWYQMYEIMKDAKSNDDDNMKQ